MYIYMGYHRKKTAIFNKDVTMSSFKMMKSNFYITRNRT